MITFDKDGLMLLDLFVNNYLETRDLRFVEHRNPDKLGWSRISDRCDPRNVDTYIANRYK